jgi:hypothetical protein
MHHEEPGDTSFSLTFMDYEKGEAPRLLTKNWPMSDESSIPVMIERGESFGGLDTQLINPKWEILGVVQKMKFDGEWVPKRGRFAIQAKLVTYKSDLEDAAKKAVSKGLSVEDAVRDEAIKYTTGLVDSEMVCDVEGLVN